MVKFISSLKALPERTVFREGDRERFVRSLEPTGKVNTDHGVQESSTAGI
jgi:hypothetical protein